VLAIRVDMLRAKEERQLISISCSSRVVMVIVSQYDKEGQVVFLTVQKVMVLQIELTVCGERLGLNNLVYCAERLLPTRLSRLGHITTPDQYAFSSIACHTPNIIGSVLVR
jgi:hypothetical protein